MSLILPWIVFHTFFEWISSPKHTFPCDTMWLHQILRQWWWTFFHGRLWVGCKSTLNAPQCHALNKSTFFLCCRLSLKSQSTKNISIHPIFLSASKIEWNSLMWKWMMQFSNAFRDHLLIPIICLLFKKKKFLLTIFKINL